MIIIRSILLLSAMAIAGITPQEARKLTGKGEPAGAKQIEKAIRR